MLGQFASCRYKGYLNALKETANYRQQRPALVRFESMDFHLQDHVVLVTGGAKGIGGAICRVLAAERATAVIVGRNRTDNEAAVGAIVANGGRAWAVEAELAQTAECQKA